MNTPSRRAMLALVGALLSPALFAQDSVGKLPCLGDATSPWADATASAGSEQRNAYVVDLAPLTTSWDHVFGIAPLVKSSRGSTAFFDAGISAQALSKLQKLNTAFASPSYGLWKTPGAGVNNDPAVNDAPASVGAPASGNQVGFTFAEFDTTDNGASYNGIVGGVFNYVPSNPGRLFVTRVTAGINGCSNLANVSQFGIGAVDESGNIAVRGDSAGSAAACGVGVLGGNNLFLLSSLARNPAMLNVISGGYPAGLFDLPATGLVVNGSATTHNTPNILPASVAAGGVPRIIGTNFDKQYVNGPAGGPVTNTLGQLAPGVTDHRGGLSWTAKNFALLGGSAGTCAVLGKASSITDTINVFGIDASGNVTGTLALTLPGVVTDNATGVPNIAGLNQFNNYGSQVAFRGGNGQIAIGSDQAGNLLVAAGVDQPSTTGTSWPVNYIAVAKVTPAGAVSWTMAAYNDGVGGKPYLNGKGGASLGNLVPLNAVTGGTPFGPSMSAPMMDSVGNIYFLSSLLPYDTGNPTSGLFRAVYDPSTFSYNLELMLRLGDVFPGLNSGRNWLISFLGIADSNSIDSGTAFSGNINEFAHGGFASAGLDPADTRALGGLVIRATIIYDTNGDDDFTTCFNGGVDENYSVLLYVGNREWEVVGQGLAGTFGLVPKLRGTGVVADGETVTLSLTDGKPFAPTYLVTGITLINANFKGGVLYPNPISILGLFPTGPSGASTVTSPWPAGVPSGLDLYFQYILQDAGAVKGFSLTNAIHTRKL